MTGVGLSKCFKDCWLVMFFSVVVAVVVSLVYIFLLGSLKAEQCPCSCWCFQHIGHKCSAFVLLVSPANDQVCRFKSVINERETCDKMQRARDVCSGRMPETL